MGHGSAPARGWLLALLLLGGIAPATAAPLLGSLFADHGVLQRGMPIPVYGQAAPGKQRYGASGRRIRDHPGRRRRSLARHTAGHDSGRPLYLTAESGSTAAGHPRCAGGRCFPVHRPVQHAGQRARAPPMPPPRSPPPPTARCARLTVADAPVPCRWPSSPRRRLECGIAADRRRFFRQLFFLRARICASTQRAGGAGDRGLGRHPRPRLGQRARRCARLGYYNDDLDMLALYQRDPGCGLARLGCGLGTLVAHAWHRHALEGRHVATGRRRPQAWGPGTTGRGWPCRKAAPSRAWALSARCGWPPMSR